MRRIILFLVLISGLLPVASASAQSGEISALRQAAVARAPVILRLKSSGLVREGANGLLEMTATLTEQDTQVLQTENRDRTAAFALIALKNKLPDSEVRRMFASAARGSTPPSPTPTASPTTGSQPTPSAPPVSPPGSTPQAAPATTPTPPPVAQPSPTLSPAPVPPIVPAPQGLPSKVLNRPAVTLYESPSEAAPRLRENLPGFSVYYVVAESGDWMQVSATEGGSPAGWFRAADVLPWRHNLAVRFAHEGRGNRQPVPFFGARTALESTLRLDSVERLQILESASGKPDRSVATAAGVVAVQPALVDRNQFYVLPILEHQAVTPREFPALRGEARLLRVAAMKQTGASSPRSGASAPGRPAMDIVFVMDLSSSMQPFVDETMKAMEGLSEKLANSSMAPSVRFGFWGYRDRSPDQDFGGGEVTKNFTPQLQTRDQFLATLKSVDVSASSAGDYAEAVFTGVKDAVEKSAWTQGAMRVVVLIGDASSHPPGHEKNPQNLSAGTVRALANAGDRAAYILPIYIQRDSPLAVDDVRVAQPQFQELGRNPNVSGEGLYLQIAQSDSPAAFGTEIRGALDQLVARLDSAADFEGRRQSPSSPTASPAVAQNAAAMADSIFSGAYLDWLAFQPAEGTPVDDSLAGWAADKDLAAPEVQALDVVFLINKSQLDTLVRLLNQVIDAGVRSRVRGTNFFSSLQSVVGRTAVDPSTLSSSAALTETALMPDFLRVLPYQSELLTLSQDEWRGMSAADQVTFLDRLNSNIQFYTDIARDPSKWHPLNPEDNREAHVTALPLDRLP